MWGVRGGELTNNSLEVVCWASFCFLSDVFRLTCLLSLWGPSSGACHHWLDSPLSSQDRNVSLSRLPVIPTVIRREQSGLYNYYLSLECGVRSGQLPARSAWPVFRPAATSWISASPHTYQSHIIAYLAPSKGRVDLTTEENWKHHISNKWWCTGMNIFSSIILYPFFSRSHPYISRNWNFIKYP